MTNSARFHVPSLRALCAAALIAPVVAAAADLKVAAAGGPEKPAQLYVALFDSADGFSADQSVAAQIVPLTGGAAQVVFTGLASGRYAVKLFADENGDGKLDKNLLGLPTERYGFSNDAKGTMGPPAFDAAAVQVDGDVAITIHLH